MREQDEATRKLQEQMRTRRERTRRWITVVGIVVLLVVTMLAAVAIFQANEANHQSQVADTQRRLAVSAQAQAENSNQLAQQQGQIARSLRLSAEAGGLFSQQPDLSLLLNMEALRITDTTEGRSSLLTDLNSQPQLVTLLQKHQAGVNGVAYTPDGNTLISADGSGTIILWNVQTHQPITQLKNPGNSVWGMSLSPDGKILATYNIDTLSLWDLNNRSLLPPLGGNMPSPIGVAFSPDSKLLAVVGASGSGINNAVFIWNVIDHTLVNQLKINGADSVAFNPDGKSVAVGDSFGSTLLWDVASGSQIGKFKGHSETRIGAVVFSSDGKSVASGGNDGQILVWDVVSRNLKVQFTTTNGSSITALIFSPDGKTLVSNVLDLTSKGSAVWLWGVSSAGSIGIQPTQLKGHRDTVQVLAFSPDGRTFASGGKDANVILWNATANVSPLGNRFYQSNSYSSNVYAVAFNQVNKQLAVADANKVMLWDKDGHTQQAKFDNSYDNIMSLAYSPDGNILAGGNVFGDVFLWDAVNYKLLSQVKGDKSVTVSSLAFSPDGKTLATAGGDKIITLWNVSISNLPTRLTTLQGHKEVINSLAFRPDGKILASGAADGVILWDVATATQQKFLTNLSVTDLAFAPDGKTLAVGRNLLLSAGIELWDVTTATKLAQFKLESSGSVKLAFSPDGKALASSDGWDIGLWDTATGLRLGKLTGHSNDISKLVFGPDGKTLLSGSRDKTAMLWNVNLDSWQALACQTANRNLTQDEWKYYLGGTEPYRKTCQNLP